jgi:hypothetical protein
MITLKIRNPAVPRKIFCKHIDELLPPDFRYQISDKDGVGIVYFKSVDRIFSVESGEKYLEIVPASGQAEDYEKIDLEGWTEVDLE